MILIGIFVVGVLVVVGWVYADKRRLDRRIEARKAKEKELEGRKRNFLGRMAEQAKQEAQGGSKENPPETSWSASLKAHLASPLMTGLSVSNMPDFDLDLREYNTFNKIFDDIGRVAQVESSLLRALETTHLAGSLKNTEQIVDLLSGIKIGIEELKISNRNEPSRGVELPRRTPQSKSKI